MKKITISVLTFLLTLCVIGGTPNPVSDVVFKPTFLTGYDSLTAGTCFILAVDGKPVAITAHHLFGPAAGLEQDLTPEQAKDFVAAIALSSMNDHKHVLTSTNMVLLPSAHAFSGEDASKDVAAFMLNGYSGPTLKVATEALKKGDVVYLYARPRGEESLRIIAAKVERVAAGILEYTFDDGRFNLAGTSGAPVLNQKGEVVAINLGGGELKGRKFGFGNPATSFMKLVSDAMNKGPGS